jgi:DNA-binding CsgD family transcriptional regulator/PAS domain-containing protein
MAEPSVEEILDLIGSLYDAARSDHNGWDAALARASRLLDARDAACGARRLAPHLRRAESLRAQLAELHGRQRSLEALIEGVSLGVVLLDAQGRLLSANAAARRIGSAGDGLEVTASGLRAAEPDDQRRLARAIASARVTWGRPLDADAIVVVRRSSGPQGYPVLVVPVAAASLEGESGHGVASGPAALLLIGNPTARFEPPPELVVRLYGLTPAQARLACALASGDSVEDYAERAGITISTARWTLKQVLARTGVERQSELVRLLLTGPAALLAAAGA